MKSSDHAGRREGVPLRTLAHARAGDKGSLINVSLVAYRMRDYARLERAVTATRVAAHLANLVAGDVVRYTLPQLGAMNFVMCRADGSDVTRTLALDAHGKSLSSALLEMEIDDE